jgi:hypothetical protein
MNPDRYTIRSVVNDLIDRLIDECVRRDEIREMLEDLSDSDRAYLDIEWLWED